MDEKLIHLWERIARYGLLDRSRAAMDYIAEYMDRSQQIYFSEINSAKNRFGSDNAGAITFLADYMTTIDVHFRQKYNGDGIEILEKMRLLAKSVNVSSRKLELDRGEVRNAVRKIRPDDTEVLLLEGYLLADSLSEAYEMFGPKDKDEDENNGGVVMHNL